jgi:hypothetical protein
LAANKENVGILSNSSLPQQQVNGSFIMPMNNVTMMQENAITQQNSGFPSVHNL